MDRFVPILKRVSENLDIPQPHKSQILLEVAADLNDIYNFHLKKGLSKEDAQKKAEEKFDLSTEAVRELANIHQPWFRKFFLRLSLQTQILLERTALIIVLCLVTALSAIFISNTNFMLGAGIFLWPILITGLIAIAISIVKFYNLFIKKEHYLKYVKDWITLILALGIVSFFISVMGYFINLYKLSTESFLAATNPLLIIILNNDNPVHRKIIQELTIWSSQSIIILLCGIAAAVICALMWFTLYNKAFSIARSELSILFDEQKTKNKSLRKEMK